MRTVTDQHLFGHKEPIELQALQDAALAVLPGHDQCDLERSPLAGGRLAQPELHAQRLPVVQDEASRLRYLDGVLADRVRVRFARPVTHTRHHQVEIGAGRQNQVGR